MMDLIGFVIALGVLVTVHEWGHYRVAVACGVRVLRFSIGFGRPLFQWVRRQPGIGTEIEFAIGVIPLGGYVKLLDTREGEVARVDLKHAFDHQTLAKRTAVVIAGPLANFVLAVVLYAATFAMGSWQMLPSLSVPPAGSAAERAGVRGGEVVQAIGTTASSMSEIASLEELRSWWMLQSDADTLHVRLRDAAGHVSRDLTLEWKAFGKGEASDANDLLPPATNWGLIAPQSPAVLRDLLQDGAAQRSGLQRGDKVLSIDGHTVVDAAQLKRMVRAAGASGDGLVQSWEIERAGERVWLDVTLDVVNEGEQKIGRIGALLGEVPQKIWVEYDILDACVKALETTWDMAVLTVVTLGKMLGGMASWQNLGGPVAIAEMAGQSLQLGLHAFVVYLALLSVSLGVFNLLPVPALDGGHLLYYLYEFLVGRPPAQRWLTVFQQVGFGVLLVLMAVALFNDLQRLSG